MAAKDLITLARAKQDIQSITDNSQDALLTVLITAISDAIEKFCRRDFNSKSYDELYSGSGDHRLLLREYPIQSVQSVRYRLVTVLKITNTNQALNQQARVSVTSTGLTLTRVASGVSTTDTSVTWAGNPTIQGVANAVNALGNGWSAQIVGDPGGMGGPGATGCGRRPTCTSSRPTATAPAARGRSTPAASLPSCGCTRTSYPAGSSTRAAGCCEPSPTPTPS
jgi:hypothetical protein